MGKIKINFWIPKFVILLLGFICFCQPAHSQDEKFKALFIYNFTKYIEWPSTSSQNEFKISILGNTSLVTEMNAIASKMKVGVKTIIVNSVKKVEDISDCQILFVSGNHMNELSEILLKIKGYHTLVITESNDGCALGAGINFITKNGSLKFEISKSNTSAPGLKVSAGLFSLGTIMN